MNPEKYILGQGNIHFSTGERDAILRCMCVCVCVVRTANMFKLIALQFDVAKSCANIF